MTDASQHTPGPWVYRGPKDGKHYIRDESQMEAFIEVFPRHDGKENPEANASLIAAAPETAAERDLFKADNQKLVQFAYEVDLENQKIKATNAKLLRDLKRIAGGHFTGAVTFALANNWQAMYGELQTIAKDAIAEAEGKL